MDDWYKKKSLFDLTKEDLEWIDKRKPRVEINDDYDLIFTWSRLIHPHNNEYEYEILVVTMPDIIHQAFYKIEEEATKEVQKNMRRVLGL